MPNEATVVTTYAMGKNIAAEKPFRSPARNPISM